MTRLLLTSILAATSLTACASGPSGPPPFDPAGNYEYTADVDGQAVPGSLTIEESEDGYTGLIYSDMFPPIAINSVQVVEQAVTIEASGPNGPLLIEFVAAEGVLLGTWAMGEQGGTFTANKSH